MGDAPIALDTGATLPPIACLETEQSGGATHAFGCPARTLHQHDPGPRARPPRRGVRAERRCTLELVSTDASGGPVDTASGTGPAGGGTQDDPFLVDWDGTVSWDGTSGDQVFNNHAWQTFVFLVPTPVRGGDPNEDDDVTGNGTVGVSENAPFRIAGLYYVSGNIDGEGGTHCDGSGWFKLTGNAVATIPFWVAVLIAVAGAVLIASARPHVGTTVEGSSS